VFFSFVQSFAQGMLIEGGARWGFDPIWVFDDASNIDLMELNTSHHSNAKERTRWCLKNHKQE
jgi:hypothetical protein